MTTEPLPPKPRLGPTLIWRLIQRTVTAFFEDGATSMGAALAYYTLFSLAPLLLIVISVAGIVFGDEAARGQIHAQLAGLMGDEGARMVQDVLRAAREPAKGLVGTLIGVGLMLVGATTVFTELQSSLDRIWRAPSSASAEAGPTKAIGALVRARLIAFGLILGIGFLLMVSLMADAALGAVGHMARSSEWPWVAQAISTVAGFALTTLLFAMIYKVLPNVSIAWRDVTIGAVVTALLFTLGRRAISAYIGGTAAVSAFGAAGSLVVVMLWVYCSALVFLMGAEFTWVYAHLLGSRRGKPSRWAVDNPAPNPA